MSVNKSYDTNAPIKNYCLAHSTALHPVQVKLNQETMKHTRVSVLLYTTYGQYCRVFIYIGQFWLKLNLPYKIVSVQNSKSQ